MIITIVGVPGSGKSTVVNGLVKKLGFESYDIGRIRREIAKKRGLTLAEYNKIGETDPSTDLEVDKFQEELGKNKDNFIVSGRTGWYFIPHSIKIFLDVEPHEGARRVFQEIKKENNRNEDKELNSVEAVAESHKKRIESDIKRYKQYYHIDIYDKKNYDLIVDTTKLSREEVLEKILNYIKQYGKK